MKKILLIMLSLTSTSLPAHPGHLFGESIHGFLHVEHIVALTAIGIIAVFVSVMRKR